MDNLRKCVTWVRTRIQYFDCVVNKDQGRNVIHAVQYILMLRCKGKVHVQLCIVLFLESVSFAVKIQKVWVSVCRVQLTQYHWIKYGWTGTVVFSYRKLQQWLPPPPPLVLSQTQDIRLYVLYITIKTHRKKEIVIKKGVSYFFGY